MPSDLTLIILNYNTPDWTSKLLSSLQKNYLKKTQYKVDVVMVDNASQDDSVKVIKKDFPWVKVMESEKNLGFAGGNNIALQKVTSRYAMLLNSDTEFSAESNLDVMIEYLDAHPEIAVMTPRLELSSGGLDLASHRGEPTLWASFTYFSKLESVFPKSTWFAQYHQLYKDFSQVHQIDACSGAALCVRTSAMEKVGLLDEQFFMYAEDLDWCKRFRDAGYQVVYFPKVVITHHKYKSGRKSNDTKLSQKTNHHFYDTMLQYYDKHYRHRHPRLTRTLIYLFIHHKKRKGVT